MFKTLPFALLIITSFSYAQKIKNPCSDSKTRNFGLKSNSLTVNQILKTELYDVNYYKLDLNMTNTSTALSGVVEIHGKAVQVLDSILIELFDTYTISEIKLNDVASIYTRNLSAISVPNQMNVGQSFKLTISYDGVPPDASTNPLGGAGMTNDFSPSWGNQVTWSLSEPFSAYEWFPCKQSLKDKADSVDVNVTVPSSCKAGSNGILTSVSNPSAGLSTYHWQHRYPIDYYLISVAVAEYDEYNTYAHPSGSDSILIQNFIYNNPDYLPYFQADIDETGTFVELFSDVFGLYPFHNEKYGHCIAPLGGGMEHQTMTTQAFYEASLTAHELAHQWWGDQVTCQSWSDIWVNEGFASYAEYIMYENLYPGDEKIDMLDRHANIMQSATGSIWVEDSLNAGRIFSSRLTYDKGAAFVHTLRFMLNNDVQFFQGLRNYQTLYKNKTALGVDVQHELENISGLDLSSAFEQWYFGEGFPTYSVKYNQIDGNLHVHISQTVSASNITPNFNNPLELRFFLSNGTDTTIRFGVNFLSTSNILPFGNLQIDSIQIDPNNWIINQDGSIINDPTMNLTGLSNLTTESDISIFPNPMSEQLVISTSSFEDYTVSIIDPKGKVIFNKEMKVNESINTSGFSTGMYLFQIISKDGKEVRRKVVKI